MKRIGIILVTLSVIALSACGGPSAPAEAPSAPTAVTATAGPGYVDLAWQHDGRGLSGFAIYRTPVASSAASSARASTAPIAELDAAARTYRDPSLPLGRGYEYRVTALGAGGTSPSAEAGGGPVWAACAAGGDAVAIADPSLDAAVRAELERTDGPLSCDDLAALTILVAEGVGIESLAGLQYATTLVTLRLNENAISDLWPLAGLTTIEHLQFHDNRVSDPAPLADLLALRVVMLGDNPIDSIEVLRDKDDLRYLGAARTTITDLSPLADKEQLIYLWVNGASNVTDFSPLAGLSALETLLIGGTAFGDGDMPMLAGMPALTRLQLWATAVSDLSALGGTQLTVELDVGGSQVRDLTPIHHMTELQHLRLGWLELQAADLAFLEGFEALTLLDLHGNDLTSLASLVALPGLGAGDRLDVSNNRLDLADAAVQADIATLVDRGVDVAYEPQRMD